MTHTSVQFNFFLDVDEEKRRDEKKYDFETFGSIHSCDLRNPI